MYYFITNPKSRTGNGLKVWNLVKVQLDKQGIEYKMYFTHFEFHATKIAQEICEKHPEIKHIVVLGGDGTVNEVINGIKDYNSVIFGYIPSGSSNDLARSLHISNDPCIALEHILSAKSFPYYDHGLVQLKKKDNPKENKIEFDEGRKFAESSGIGFDASITYEALNSNLKKILNKIKLGKLTYGLLAIKQLFRYKPCHGKIIIDKHNHIKLKNIFFIASMIQPYEGGGFKMAPNANPTDGKLSVCIFYNIPKLMAFFILPSVILGKHQLFKGVKIFDCETLEIQTDHELIVHTDGEYAGKSNHIKLCCAPQQIRMITL
jgi:YegS/Rv2252/BmrU family lipid kinase